MIIIIIIIIKIKIIIIIHSVNLPEDFLRLADASSIEPAARQPTLI